MSAVGTIVPVGLFGFVTKTSFVLSVIAAASATRSNVSLTSGTRTCSASTSAANSGYASNDGQHIATWSPDPT